MKPFLTDSIFSKESHYAHDQIVPAFAVEENQKSGILKALSSMLAKELGKPENYVMVIIDQCAAMMSGGEGKAAFADIRGIGGFSGPVNKKLSNALCDYILKTFNIPPERVYMNFTNVNAADWGWNKGTFG